MHAPFVFSSIQPYPPVAIAVFFYLEFMWGGAPPPLSHRVCHTLAAVTHLPSPSTLGEVAPHLPSLAGLFIYSSRGGVPLPLSPELTGLTLFVTYLFFFQLLVYYSVLFFFFPWVGVSLSRGLC
jgi:hypothetical protein